MIVVIIVCVRVCAFVVFIVSFVIMMSYFVAYYSVCSMYKNYVFHHVCLCYVCICDCVIKKHVIHTSQTSLSKGALCIQHSLIHFVCHQRHLVDQLSHTESTISQISFCVIGSPVFPELF